MEAEFLLKNEKKIDSTRKMKKSKLTVRDAWNIFLSFWDLSSMLFLC